MSEFRWKGKDADDLTREEAIEAFKGTMAFLRDIGGLPHAKVAEARERMRAFPWPAW